MPALDALRDEIRKHYLADEDVLLRRLIESADLSPARREAISAKAAELVRAVPNVSFSKTNFASYNFSIRGIGTKALSVSSDPAVAISFSQ